MGSHPITFLLLYCVSVDDLEKNEEAPIHSSRSVDPRIQSSPSAVDLPMNSSRSVMSTSSAAAQDVISYLEKVDVNTRLEDIDQVYNRCTGLIGFFSWK